VRRTERSSATRSRLRRIRNDRGVVRETSTPDRSRTCPHRLLACRNASITASPGLRVAVKPWIAWDASAGKTAASYAGRLRVWVERIHPGYDAAPTPKARVARYASSWHCARTVARAAKLLILVVLESGA